MKEKINEIKIEQVVTNLETMKKENMDIYDIAAVVIMDIHDMMIASTNEKFKKEKSDLKKQLKVLKRVINNKTFKGVKHFKK